MPILFYAGNEGDIWSFYKNSGFMTKTLAEKYGALVILGEHRYFGESYPIKNKTQALLAPDNAYLTIENTMMDYVELIKAVKKKYNAENRAVIVFGGSYGGMLAAWLRMKYPSVFQGALAASAPILQFKGANETGFSDIITADFAETMDDKRCSLGIKQGFSIINDLKTRTDVWAEFSELLHTCETVNNTDMLQSLIDHYENGFAYMAMTDYPTPNSFLNPMPAWPVNASCEVYKDIAPSTDYKRGDTASGLTDDEKKYLTAINGAANIYFNYTG
jgi:pimeloyl-ACP methyl ester carboxylesterase